MFRMSGTIYKDGRIVRDCVSRQEDYSVSRTQHVLTALREICDYLVTWTWKSPSGWTRISASSNRKARPSFIRTASWNRSPLIILRLKL